MADVRARKRASRVMRNLTVSPRTEARLTSLAARTGLSRGRIVDLALANVQTCPVCEGIGAVSGPADAPRPDPNGAPCAACAAAGLVPGPE
jgi:hypothetical protein